MNTLCLAIVLAPVWTYLVVATVLTLRLARRPIVAPSDGPPVTVLKPLHGAEPGLYENLRSFTDQDHPELQLVFGVRDRNDGALPVARALIADRPDRDIEMVVDPRVSGSNLKIANLENMLPAARHDVVVLADSDMRVTRDYLSIVTAPLAERSTGLVTCLYKGVPSGGLWSEMAALHINFGFLPGAIVGEAIDVGHGCFGATIALRREVLDRIGGFARLRNELADDHRMGAAVRGLGLKQVLSPYIVENRVSEPSFASLWRHELRWARTSRLMAPGGFAGSLVTHTTAVSTLAAVLLASGPEASAIFLISLLMRWVSAWATTRWLELPRAGLWLLPLRDALSFAVFIGSFCGRRVQWRNQLLQVAPSGRISVQGD